MLSSSEQPGSLHPKSAPGQPPPLPSRNAALENALRLISSLEPNDRTRLIVELWEKLPPKNRAAFIAYGIESIQVPEEEKAEVEKEQPILPAGPTLWDALFDPDKASGLYSAPRRFDLAMIFVVTAAYSILFGAMSALDVYIGPVTKVAVGVFVTIVGVCQAFYQDKANPRGVSIVAGAISLSIILTIIGMVEPRWFDVPLIVVIVIFGLIGGAIAGYLAGGVVAGIFLLADVVRKWRARPQGGDQAAAGEASADDSESPWTN